MLGVTSAFVLYLVASGYSLRRWQADSADVIARLALSLGLGLLVNLSLMLTGQPIGRVLALGAVTALTGVWTFWRRWTGTPGLSSRASATGGAALAVIGCIVAVYVPKILGEPLTAWDARSVWFFHAKIIWLAGSLGRADWNHPSILFSSPDYPKLVASMAAQFGYLRGYWNEYFPKASLLVLLVSALLWVFSFRRKTATFTLLLLTCFFTYEDALSNGYMDGYLMVFAGVAVLCAGRYLESCREFDLQAACCTLGIACCLKNEGLLFALCLVLAALPNLIFQRGRLACLQSYLARRPSRLIVPAVAVAPVVVWRIDQVMWGLTSALTKEPAGVAARIVGRLSDGVSPGYIAGFLLFRANGLWVPAVLVGALVLFARFRAQPVNRGVQVAVLTAALHFVGMFTVYLSSPVDLYFLLSTSAFRTMGSTRMALVVALVLLLSDLEMTPGAAAQPQVGVCGLSRVPGEGPVLD